MTAAPFRRPPMIDVSWGERERWWTRTTRRLAERRLWGKAESLAELGELVAQFCEGRLLETPGHGGPRDPETVGIAAPLAHANRQGFVTTGSQPGCDEREWEQRAAVDGWATPATVKRLRGLVAGTRLQMRVVTERPRRSNYDDVVNVSRQHTPDGVREHTHFGFTPGTREPFIDLGRSDLTEGAYYVSIYDPQWGDESLLWDRLGQPDWDNPDGTQHIHGGRAGPDIRSEPPQRPDLADLRRGRWYDTDPITTTTSSAGGAVSSIEETREAILRAVEKMNEGLGALQQSHASLEEAQGQLMRATEGSGQADVSEANGLLAQAVAGVEEVRQQVSAAISASEGVANRL